MSHPTGMQPPAYRGPRPKSPSGRGRGRVGATPNRSAAVVHCPGNCPPCDVLKLYVKAEVADADGDKTLQLQTTKIRAGTPVRGPFWTDAREKLKSYDLVMEMHAGYSAGPSEHAFDKAVNITVRALHAGKCGKKRHPVVTAATMNWRPGIVAVNAKGKTSLEVKDVRALGGGTSGSGAPKGFAALFDALSSILQMGLRPHEIAITAQGCGVREKGKGAKNRQLRALLRIYRRDIWTIGVKVGALELGADLQASKKGSVKEGKATTTASGPRGSKTKTWSQGHLGKRKFTKYAEETKQGKKVSKYSSSTLEGGARQQKLQFGDARGHRLVTTRRRQVLSAMAKLDAEPGSMLMLDRNGVDYAEACQIKIGRGQKIPIGVIFQRCIKNATRAIQAIKTLFKSSPKWGLFFKADAGFFDGAFVMQFGPCIEPSALDERYWPLTFPAVVGAQMTLVRVSLSVGAGMEFINDAAEFSLTLTGTIELKVPVSFTVTIGVPRENPVTIGLSPTAGVNIKIQAVATVLGVTLGNVYAMFTTGLNMTNGQFVIDPKRGNLKLTGDIKTDPGVIVVHASMGLGSWDHKWELFPPRSVYKFA